MVDAFDYARKPLDWIEELLKDSNIDFHKADSIDLTLVLLDLTLYEYDDLVNMSFEFIHSLYTNRSSLLSQLKEIQLLQDEK